MNPSAYLESTLLPPLIQTPPGPLGHATLHEESPKAKAPPVCICERADLDVIKPLSITFYDEIAYIANHKRVTFETGREIAIIRRLETSI